MKKITTILISLLIFVTATGATIDSEKIALKELVDTFSILADKKDTKTQSFLFTKNAILKSYHGNDLMSEYTGRENIEKACAKFLALFSTVYHINGQQTVELIDKNTAKGIAYCQVVLIGKDENGKNIMTTQGIWYEDEYKKENGKWLISNRTSHFVWTDKKLIITKNELS